MHGIEQRSSWVFTFVPFVNQLCHNIEGIDASYEADLREVLDEGRVRVEAAELSYAARLREAGGPVTAGVAAATAVAGSGGGGGDGSGSGFTHSAGAVGGMNLEETPNGTRSHRVDVIPPTGGNISGGGGGGAGTSVAGRDNGSVQCSSCSLPLGQIGGVLVPRKALGMCWCWCVVRQQCCDGFEDEFVLCIWISKSFATIARNVYKDVGCS
jgi:hypothetical protein